MKNVLHQIVFQLQLDMEKISKIKGGQNHIENFQEFFIKFIEQAGNIIGDTHYAVNPTITQDHKGQLQSIEAEFIAKSCFPEDRVEQFDETIRRSLMPQNMNKVRVNPLPDLGKLAETLSVFGIDPDDNTLKWVNIKGIRSSTRNSDPDCPIRPDYTFMSPTFDENIPVATLISTLKTYLDPHVEADLTQRTQIQNLVEDGETNESRLDNAKSTASGGKGFDKSRDEPSKRGR